MSTSVTVAEVKDVLRIRHSSDDALLQKLIENAEGECRDFLDVRVLPTADPETNSPLESEAEPVSDSSTLEGGVRQAIYLLVEAAYDRLDGNDLERFRKAAEVKLMPHRKKLGV